MEVWVNLQFDDGDFDQGFSKVKINIDTFYTIFYSVQLEIQLPPAPEIPNNYECWKKIYESLVQVKSRGFKNNQVTNLSTDTCFEYTESLRSKLNQWLLPIKSQLEPIITSKKNVDIRLVVNTHGVISEATKNILHRIPWQECHLFGENSSLEVALCFKDSMISETGGEVKSNSEIFRRIKIINIFGDSRNLDTSTDEELIVNLEKRGAQTIVLKEPKRETLHKLWDEPCDILFFAGHSESPDDGQKGIISINPNESLDLEEIPKTLKSAIRGGLKLAIFNSCDGLGLAQRLADLNLPYVIVWREPVPDRIAHKFLNFFLHSYAGGDSLFTAVWKARGKLQELTEKSESEKPLPGVSWLPIICKNTLETPPAWEDLGGLSGKLPECPYQGLSAFREEEADFFFGREKFVDELVAAVQSKSLVAVVGASGSGKSSVVFAGLVPGLRKLENVQIISFRPGNNPLNNLAITLNNHCDFSASPQQGNSTDTQRRLDEMVLEANLRHDETNLAHFITNNIAYKHLVLIADQFEELYTLAPQGERQPFLDALIYAIDHITRFTLVLTLRADFYGYALSYRPFSDALQKGIYNLAPMNREDLRYAVEKPAQKMKVVLEEGLTDILIKDLGNEPGRLPLFEFTLTQLWQKPRRWFLTHEAYQEIGGLEKALANYADTVLDNLSQDDRKRAEQIFIQLVRPGEGTEDTRRVATRREVGGKNWDLVQQLANKRLLVTGYDRSTENKEETVEIIHEALIREWGTFHQWIQDNRKFRTWQERLRGAMQQWQETGQDEGALLRGAPLAEAESWLQVLPLDISKSEQMFIQLSLELRDKTQREEKERTQRELEQAIKARKAAQMRNRVALMSSMALSGFAIFAFFQWSGAQQQTIVALNQASESSLLSNQQLPSLVTALQAGQQLKNAIIQPNATLKQTVSVTLQQAVYGVQERNRLIGHESYINIATFSPDGEIIASGSNDNTIKLWDREGKLTKTLSNHTDSVSSISFSQDGKLFASGSYDITVKLWTRDGQMVKDFPKEHTKRINTVSFSPDGQMIASGSHDKTVKLWNLNGQLLKTLSGHKKAVRSVSFSPDGQMIASISTDETIKVWSRNGELLHTFFGCEPQYKDKCKRKQDDVTSVSFSPDGKTIVSGGYGGKVKLWNLKDKQPKISRKNKHRGSITSVSFSPDEKIIASTSHDRTIKLWSRDGKLIKTLQGHNGVVSSVSFTPDGKTLATASWDGTIKIWKPDGQSIITPKHNKSVSSVSFSPDSKILASGSDDNTIKLWNRDGQLLKTLSKHTKGVNSVSFSPDGKTLASGSDDNTIKLWNRDGKLLKTLSKHTKGVNSVSFSPDGKIFASGSDDNTIKLWNWDGQLLKTLSKHTQSVKSVSFSPDGKTLASGSDDNTIKLWNRDGKLLKTLGKHKSSITDVSFSPDGKTLASASQDSTVKLWSLKSLQSQKPPKTLIGHGTIVSSVSFTPDKILASGSSDNNIKLWNQEGKEIKILTGHRHDVKSVSFSPDGKMLASGSRDNTVILWNLHLDNLLVRGCDWVRDYLKNNPNVSESDRTLCNGIGTQK